MAEETDPYLEVARRFFNEFLEMKLLIDQGGVVDTRTQERERKKYEKELKKWEDANRLLKATANDIMRDNERLVDENARLEEEATNLRRQINEFIMNQTDVVRKLHDYPLDQHMRPDVYARWQEDVRILKAMMEETPKQKGD